jgi:hypothetical protein
MPQGDYDLNLIRDVVDGGESAAVAGGQFPILVFATEGAVDVSSTRTEAPVRLGRGEGQVFRGDISIVGRGNSRSTYVAAVIGDAVTGGEGNPTAVPVEETPASSDEAAADTSDPSVEAEVTETSATEEDPNVEATPAGASVRIAIRLCREGMTIADLNPRGCQRADGNYRLALVAPDGTRLRLNDAAKVDPSFVRWSGLAPGVYAPDRGGPTQRVRDLLA